MAKYHINPKTGNPNKCAAKLGNCPFGSEAEHYSDRTEALAAYEAKMALETGQALSKNPSNYKAEPVGALTELVDGTRFLKVASNRWETSQHGGRVLSDKELTAIQQRLMEAGASVNSTPQTVPVKPTLLQSAAYEEGFQARKYFLLYNHRDPEQLAAAKDTVQDQELVETLTRLNELERHRAGYQELLATPTIEAQLRRESAAELKLLEAEIEAQKAVAFGINRKYAKQLVVHGRSLDALERLVAGGVRDRPAGLQERLAKLEKLRRETKPISPVAAKLEEGTPEAFLEAAQLFGNRDYLKAAESYLASSQEADRMGNDLAELRRAKVSTGSEVTRQVLDRALREHENAHAVSLAATKEAREKLGLFLDDVRDRGLYEEDIARELNALRTLAS